VNKASDIASWSVPHGCCARCRLVSEPRAGTAREAGRGVEVTARARSARGTVRACCSHASRGWQARRAVAPGAHSRRGRDAQRAEPCGHALERRVPAASGGPTHPAHGRAPILLVRCHATAAAQR
jgi:hypothetical protein